VVKVEAKRRKFGKLAGAIWFVGGVYFFSRGVFGNLDELSRIAYAVLGMLWLAVALLYLTGYATRV
jgi:hypothetical protein